MAATDTDTGPKNLEPSSPPVQPPGLAYLTNNVNGILMPPAFGYGVMVVLHRGIGIAFSKWVTLAVCLAAYPVILASFIWFQNANNKQAAIDNGAVLAPRVKDSSIGNIRTLLAVLRTFKTGYIADGVGDLMKELGHTINLRMLFSDRIVTSDPEVIKAVLATHFQQFEKGETLRNTLYSLLGTGVFASDGEMWKFHRSMTRPFFTKDRVSHFDNFERHTNRAIGVMKARFEEGHPVDFQDLASRFTMDSATEFLFGKDIESLNAPVPYPYYANTPSTEKVHDGDKFATSFSAALDILATRMRFSGNWPLREMFEDKAKTHQAICSEAIDPILKEAIAKKKANGDVLLNASNQDREIQEDDTLLDHLVNYTDDPILIRDEIMNLAVAGRDTTACLLTFSVYMLAQYPQIMRKLRDEILSQVGSDRRPTFDDIKTMKYLKAFLNEVLRLYPPLPFNIRAAKDNVVINFKNSDDKPLYIPAGTRVSYSVWLMQRREDLWGPTAQEFDPERFLDERMKEYLIPNPFIFLPFNAGPRICLGQQFAYNEASFFLIRLLQTFSSITLAPDAQPPASRPPESWKSAGGRKAEEKVMMKSHLTLYMQDGLWLNMA